MFVGRAQLMLLIFALLSLVLQALPLRPTSLCLKVLVKPTWMLPALNCTLLFILVWSRRGSSLILKVLYLLTAP